MKHLALGIGILAALLALSLWAMGTLDRTASQVTDLLQTAWEQASDGSYDQAAASARKAQAIWEKSFGLAASMVDHERLDKISQGFTDLEAWDSLAQREEFSRQCLALAELVRSMAEAEQPYYYNIL